MLVITPWSADFEIWRINIKLLTVFGRNKRAFRPKLIPTCFFVLSLMVIPRYLIKHFQRLGCVINNQNEIDCDAYAESLS